MGLACHEPGLCKGRNPEVAVRVQRAQSEDASAWGNADQQAITP